ncbi:molybdopterin-dependent oxidoreductase [Roseovarius sp. Pro17]|uniref:molybdopterin-dependent oxidoreductase n=1 Tax=Roseovarius sp. Pro17 TaxID=3108175 RepID=UPI002D778ADE|nr:molybdopterin-dependent oxidoreductase [Roseovarius sp. Pro17]
MNISKLLSVVILSLYASQAISETVLTVTGKDASGAQEVILYSLDDLKALDQIVYDTVNDFVKTPTQFSGPLLRDVLAPLSLSENAELKLTALNNFQTEIPITDVMNYDVIVALEKRGAPMSIRENGPLWVIYPVSDHPELRAQIYNNRMIWQLIDIEVE